MARRRLVRFQLAFIAVGAIGAAVAVIAACGDEAVAPEPNVNPDSGFRVDGAVGSADGAVFADGGTSGDASPDGSPDGGERTPLGYTTCKTLKDEDPSLASGVYDINLDTDGGTWPTLSVYCDMTFAGGGWTLIESFTGAQTTSSLLAPAGPDGGYLVASPRPGSLGGLAGWVTKELAEKSSQVHIRYSFARDAGAADPDAGSWITSRAPASTDDVTIPIKNLRNLDVMSKGTDGGFPDWTGPKATAEKLSWKPNEYGCGTLINTRKYPQVLWSCGNFDSLNVFHERVSFTWDDNTNQPLEVYVR